MVTKKTFMIIGLFSLAVITLGVAGCSVRVGEAAFSPTPSVSTPSVSTPSVPSTDVTPTFSVSPSKVPATEAFLGSLVGLPLGTAQGKAADAGYVTRVVSIDGQPQMVTMDYSDGRLNFEIVKDKVTKVTVG